jgi:hypothetical protein
MGAPTRVGSPEVIAEAPGSLSPLRRRRLVLFAGLYDKLFNQPERETVTATVLDWFAART